MKHTLIVLALLIGIPRAGNAQTIKAINKPVLENLDQITTFHEGLAAVRKGTQWGFINTEGNLVIDFRADLVWNENPAPNAVGITSLPYPRFKDGRCMIRAAGEEEIPVYGFIDQKGQTVIDAYYLNLTEFNDGLAIGIYVKRNFRGKNKFQLNIYEYSFTEVVLNPSGEMVWPIGERDNILMQKRRYEVPKIQSRILEKNLISVETIPGQWEIRNIKLEADRAGG